MKRVVACITGLLLGWAALCLSSASAQEETTAKDQPKAEAPAATAKPAAATEQPDAPAEKANEEAKDEAGHSHAKGEDHGDHAHHDPHDNTHKNASPKLSSVDEIRFDQALATFIIFMLLAAILAKFAWGPITDGLDKREQGIAQMIDDAKMAQQQAEAQLRSYEAKLAAAAEEARALVAQARADADATRERELAATKAENEKLLQRNKDEIEAAKNVALQQIAEKSVNTAISLASNIVRREVKPEDHDALVTDALSKFTKLN
jgi:F-type H+-transporting ATPase subunit b